MEFFDKVVFNMFLFFFNGKKFFLVCRRSEFFFDFFFLGFVFLSLWMNSLGSFIFLDYLGVDKFFYCFFFVIKVLIFYF